MKAILLFCLLAISFTVSFCNNYNLRRQEVAAAVVAIDELLSLDVEDALDVLDNNLIGIQIQPIVRHPPKKGNDKPIKC